MAAVVASKPLLPPKTKRPPALPIQTSIKGTNPSPVPPSPSSAAKRLPGQKHPPPTPTSTTNATNGIARPKRKESQRPGDPHGRPPRLQTRNNVVDGGSLDRRANRVFPAPYVPSEAHILKKFKGLPPSLIVHLHPTHFRFEQQDGSFSYHSEMRLFIEHLQKKTIPHDMLEELKASNVQFYDGWLIVRVVDHKSVSASAGPSSNNDPDDQIPFSIHNYNPYITPSPWVPYPAGQLPKPPSRGRSSPVPKQEPGEASASQTNGDSSTLNGEGRSGKNSEPTSRPNKPQTKVFHVALRPTIMSRHMDIVIESMTPDTRTLNRRQSQAFPARTPGASNMPAPGTPISAVPPTPSLEKAPPPKRQKMKVDPKDLLDYEAGIVRATAPPIFLEPLKTFEEAQALQHFLKDPLCDEEPPSPKGRKRTVAELAADDALAKEQERFMLIMDERNSGGSAAVNVNAVDGQASAGLFQPRFERFNALDNIKAQNEERKRRAELTRFHQHEAQQAAKAQQDEENKRMEMARAQQQENIRQRQMIRERQAAVLAAQQQQQQQQQHAIPQLNGVPPNMQRQMMQASQAQGASPIIRTSTPHLNSSPIVGQTRPGHSVPMTVTSSNQGGAGSPPRPGSALQHGHPGIAMARSQSNQGPSRNGTPQVPHSTPGMPNATPVLRHGTPAQQMSQASPHGNMMAHTPQMGHAMMGPGQMPPGMAQNPQAAQMQAHQQQQLMLQRQQNLARQGMNPNMPNGGPQYTPEQLAHLNAQAHARQAAMQAQHQQQQQHHQVQQGGNQVHPGSQTPAQNQAAYQAALVQSQKNQMAQAQINQGMQQGSPPQSHPTPQQHAAQMQHQASMQQQQLAQNQGQNQQLPNGMTLQQQQQLQQQQNHVLNQRAQQMHGQLMNTNQVYAQQYHQRTQALFTTNVQQLAQQVGGDQTRIPPQQIDALKKQIGHRAMREIQEMMKRQQAQQRAHQQQQQQQMGPGGPVGGGQNPAMMQQMQAQQRAMEQQQHNNIAQYQQQLQQMHQGNMMNGLPGAGVMPK